MYSKIQKSLRKTIPLLLVAVLVMSTVFAPGALPVSYAQTLSNTANLTDYGIASDEGHLPDISVTSYEADSGIVTPEALSSGVSFGTTINVSDASPAANGTGWAFSGITYTIFDGANVTITGDNRNGGSVTVPARINRNIRVAAGANVTVTLDNAYLFNFTGNFSPGAPFGIGNDANVTLNLRGTNHIVSRHVQCIAISIGNNAVLTINALETGANLTAQANIPTNVTTGADSGIGIGTHHGLETTTTLVINSGTVTANGAAQQGTGAPSNILTSGVQVSNLIINGGNLTATSHGIAIHRFRGNVNNLTTSITLPAQYSHWSSTNRTGAGAVRRDFPGAAFANSQNFRYVRIQSPDMPMETRITRLVMDDTHSGVINQTNRTITFNIPDYLLDANNRYTGIITGLLPNRSFTFIRNGVSSSGSVGSSVTLGNGDQVHVNGTVIYTIVINGIVTSAIDRLKVDDHEGEIDQTAQTITFNVPECALDADGKLAGAITELAPNRPLNVDDGIFTTWNLTVSSPVTLGHGYLVYIHDSRQYEILLNILPPLPLPLVIEALTIGGIEGVVCNTNETITFTVPGTHPGLSGGGFGGTMDSVSPANVLLAFFVAGQNRYGFGVGGIGGDPWFHTGSRVFIQPDGREYTLVVTVEEEPGDLIKNLVVGGVPGAIDHIDRTITFDILQSQIAADGRFTGAVSGLAPGESLTFVLHTFFPGTYPNFVNGWLVGFYDGDEVFLETGNGMVYTLRLNISPDPTVLTMSEDFHIGDFETTVDLANRMITVRIPQGTPTLPDGRYAGVMGGLRPGESVTFVLHANAPGVWPGFVNGSFVGFSHGDEVFLSPDRRYTLIVEYITAGEPRRYNFDDPAIIWSVNPSANAYERHSPNVNGVITLTFEGTGITYIGTRNVNRAIVEIFINGVSMGKVDAHAGSLMRGQVLFDVQNLGFGQHVIEIRNTGQTSGINTQMGVEAFVVTQ